MAALLYISWTSLLKFWGYIFARIGAVICHDVIKHNIYQIHHNHYEMHNKRHRTIGSTTVQDHRVYYSTPLQSFSSERQCYDKFNIRPCDRRPYNENK